SDGNASFLRAARAGNLEKVLEYLKGSTDINTSNANGLNALHLASKEGHVNIVTELLKRGANVDAATKKGNTALHIASLAGQEEIVKILVQNSAKVNLQSQNGFTPLYMAAQENHAAVVKFLLANNAQQGLATEDGFTPLAVALQQGHDKVVAVLLENDSRGKVKLPALHIAAKKDDTKAAALLLQNEHNVDVQSKSGFTPLHIAAHYGNINVGTLLADKGADVNYQARNNIVPLHVASKWGRTNICTLLLDRGAQIETRTKDGLTPLHCAARSGHEAVVDLMLERGAQQAAKTKNGLTPLHMAAQGDHVDCARLLLYHKAPVDEVTVDYLTPLHVAAHCGNVRTAKLLLDKKCEPNSRALNGFTPLHIACKKNRIKVVELLLKYLANLEATTESGLTPLHVASFMGHMNIVLYLLQHGANPDTPTVRGETALHLAARANQTDIIRILLRNGAQVDARAREQQTPLHIASRLGNTDICSLLLQHGASPNATTKDLYTPLHIAAKEGQEEVAAVLLEHGADQNLTTKKGFTPLHIAAKYGKIKVARLLLQKDADPNVQGKNGLTPLHVATHYNHVNVALLLLDNKATPHCAAKNGYTPLHIAAKKNQMDIATTLLEYGAKPDAESKSGFTPLHLASQEGHTDMVSLLLEHKASVNCSAKNGLTPMHLAAQEDKVPVAEVLVKYGSEIDPRTKAGYTPLHTACHFGQINMIRFLLEHEADVNAVTKLGYTPLHQAAQQGHVLVINLLLKYGANPDALTNTGQTALSIADRLGYISVVEVLKNITTVSVTTTTTTEEKYKVVAPETMQETLLTDSEDEGGNAEEAPLSEQHVYVKHYEPKQVVGQSNATMEALVGPLESEDHTLSETSYNYMTEKEMKYMADDSMSPSGLKPPGERGYSMTDGFTPSIATAGLASMETSHFQYPDESFNYSYQGEDAIIPASMSASYASYKGQSPGPDAYDKDTMRITSDAVNEGYRRRAESSYSGHSFASSFDPDNVLVDKTPASSGFLVSFMVDARGGAMRGCRHSGVRLIIPPRKASMPTRVTCKLVKKEKLLHPPPLMEGEALASRILEMGPHGAQFLGPVIIEVPHYASLRGREREIVILRSDNGETWKEHTMEATDDAIHSTLNGSFEDLETAEDLFKSRTTRILTTDFPQYFAIVTRVRRETNTIGVEGGMLSSTVVPQVQLVFPERALKKEIKIGLQAQPLPPEMVSKLLGNRVAVSPIVTVEPRRRKFHMPFTLTIPVPKASQKGMINQYGGDAPTLRLLFSIPGGSSQSKLGGTSPAEWEDITGKTPLTFVNDCVSFATNFSARYWLMDCQNVNDSTKMATELYKEAIHVPFMSKFVVFSKHTEPQEGRLRVFCMTDDKMDKTLETQEHFTEVARSKEVEVLEGKPQWVEMAGNLVPVTKSGEQLHINFHAFRENRLPFTVRVRDTNQEAQGRIAFMKDPRVGRDQPSQTPICNLNVSLPDEIKEESLTLREEEAKELKDKFDQVKGIVITDTVTRADLHLADIAEAVGDDWVILARELQITEYETTTIQTETTVVKDQGLAMLQLWVQKEGDKATGNELEGALRRIGRDDVVRKCMTNIETVTETTTSVDVMTKSGNDDEGFAAFKDELGPSRDASMKRGLSLDVSYDEQDIVKESESAEESSEAGSVVEKIPETIPEEEPISKSEKEAAQEDFIEKVEGMDVSMGMDDRMPSSSSEDSLHDKDKQGRDRGARATTKTPPPSPSAVEEVSEPKVEEVVAKLAESEAWQSSEELDERPPIIKEEPMSVPEPDEVDIHTERTVGEPETETYEDEVEETLPDGTVVKRKIIRTRTVTRVTERTTIEGVDTDITRPDEPDSTDAGEPEPVVIEEVPTEQFEAPPSAPSTEEAYQEQQPEPEQFEEPAALELSYERPEPEPEQF
ncbi:unnamed protein product, partial [Owenia fusiformis]